MPRDLSTFFYPTSVAVIGASRSPQKVGAITLKNIQNSKFKGRIYPVNP
ncbi:CoA-binding protein, partial [candidate division WWE3 bacterium CG10_big_fil_rev_8_21_14_0_10_39_14]